MKVIIQGKQLKVPEELKTYVYERLVDQLTRFYDDEAAELRVQFGDINGPKGGRDKECNITFYMPNARTIQIGETTTDLYGSLDVASDRFIRVVKKEIERMREPVGHKEKPLGSVVSEGGVPGGLLEELPFGKLFSEE